MSKLLAGEQLHVVPGLAPVDAASTAKQSDVVFAKNYQGIQFLVQFGVITGDTVVVTVEECDDATPTNTTAIAFKYRKSAAVGTDSMGALTAATTSGVTVAAADDGKALLIDIDPSALTNGRPGVRVVVTPGGSMSVCLVNIIALLQPRYPQASQVSAVA